jgi:1-acyl-sn-glycerol-3-phosphate acyltransferase
MRIIFLWIIYPLWRPFYLVLLLINTALLAMVVVLMSLFDRHGNWVHYVGRFWSLLNIYLSGTRVKLKGRTKIDPRRTYIVMANHQSLFDVWALIGKLPLQIRWIVKKELRSVPLFGYALERMGHIYIDRKHPQKAYQRLKTKAAGLHKGSSVVIFPEGTRSPDGLLRDFRLGGATMALTSGINILPVTVNGGRFALPKGTLGLMPGKMEIIIGAPIDPTPYQPDQARELMNAVKAAVAKNLDLTYGTLT